MASEEKQVEYASEIDFKTSDNYKVKIKSVVAYIGETEKNVFNSIENTLKEHINSLTLMDALELVDESNFSKLLGPINQRLDTDKVNSFAIKTVDAVETAEELDIAIDPNLESQKQRTGLLGKIKSLFGK